jgi:hypothetical protein
MMYTILDYTLVFLAIGLALGYLIRRKISTARRMARDWTTGHAEVCSSCPVIKIHEQARKAKSGN